MMPQRFLLAVPRGEQSSDPLTWVRHASQVRRDCPALWVDASTRVLAHDDRAIILGPLFCGGTPATATDVARVTASARSMVDRAATIVGEMWGSYFAILIDARTHALSVMSDPSGLLPVYRTMTATHLLFTSDPMLFASAGAHVVSVSWPHLAAHLARPELRQAATCLSHVDEVRPGVLIPLSAARAAPVRVWRPDEFVPRDKAPDFDAATTLLRRCATITLSAWAGIAGPVAVAASGGVDSSLIAAALAADGQRFDCITLATRDPSCDERAFVRALADHAGVRCIAAIYDPARVDPLRAASSGLARPSRKTFMQALDAALDDARRDLGARAIFDGNGGDNLFCFLHSAAPVLDALAADGVRSACSTFIDMCGVTGCTIATMAKAVARRAWRLQRPRDWPSDRHMLSDDWSDTVPIDPLMPWWDAAVGRQRGKHDHLRLLMQAQNHIHGLGGIATPRFSPLLSQPMVELCLSLPTWLWCRGRINRAPARAAFADMLPLAIRRRTSKAGPDSFIRTMFVAKRAQIRDLLTDGLLVRNGIVDPNALHCALKTDALSRDPTVYRLLDLVEAEAWARSWAR